MMDDDGLWWGVTIVDDLYNDLFAYISFLLQEKIFKGSTTMKEKKGILQNKCFMVYLYKNEMNN